MRVMLLVGLTLASASVAAQHARPSSLQEVFEAANVAASRGDYRSAIYGYQRLVEAGVRDGDVYFNLATAFAQSGDYPHAILNFERALEVRPNDGKIHENLRSAERALEETRAEVEGEAMIQRPSSMGEALYASFTEDALAYVLVVANLVFFACLGWAWAAKRRSGLLVAIVVSAGLALGFCAMGLGVKAGMFRDGLRAVALDDRVSLREAPDPRARVRGETRGGDRAEVIAADGDFVKLRVVSGAEGWVEASSVGLINPDERLH